MALAPEGITVAAAMRRLRITRNNLDNKIFTARHKLGYRIKVKNGVMTARPPRKSSTRKAS